MCIAFLFPDASSLPRGLPIVHYERASPQVSDRTPPNEHQGYQRTPEGIASWFAPIIHRYCGPGEAHLSGFQALNHWAETVRARKGARCLSQAPFSVVAEPEPNDTGTRFVDYLDQKDVIT